jgi:hypothetical protein
MTTDRDLRAGVTADVEKLKAGCLAGKKPGRERLLALIEAIEKLVQLSLEQASMLEQGARTIENPWAHAARLNTENQELRRGNRPPAVRINAEVTERRAVMMIEMEKARLAQANAATTSASSDGHTWGSLRQQQHKARQGDPLQTRRLPRAMDVPGQRK